jgi:dethiobiotin synthetase
VERARGRRLAVARHGRSAATAAAARVCFSSSSPPSHRAAAGPPAGRRQFDSLAPEEPPRRWAKFPDGSRFWNRDAATGRLQRPIFVAATRQHVGKTTCSLALMSGLQKRYKKVGFLKPVGQQHVEVSSEKTGAALRVDKDCVLVREHFRLDHIDYRDMSPVIIPAGYTKKFVDGEITLQQQIRDVETAMEHVAAASDVVLCEGTGHCAVGSIVGLNNAKVASLIGADMVLVANGGLGSAFDELELNRVLCQHYNVRIAGVILNKVIPDKLEQTAHYMSKAMRQAWGVPLLGCIPDRPFLGCPALADLETLFKTELISGHEHRFRHYAVDDINVVTTSLTRFLENLREKPARTLYICKWLWDHESSGNSALLFILLIAFITFSPDRSRHAR